MAVSKKNKRKNSNYKKTYKFVGCDQLCRKVLCDFRNMEPPKEELGEKADVDDNLYETAVELCRVANVITQQEKTDVFDGKNHVPMSAEEVSEFTGIPVHQVEKNLFAFKIRDEEDFVRVSMIRLVLCDLVSDIIQKAIDADTEITEEEKTRAAGYINFCTYVGIITEEQSWSIYVMVKQRNPLELPMISSITGIDTETLAKMVQ
ncbi:MAG: hypothetical protein HFE90_01205 [Firmicutes bacterium]|nr:hypothetical protein [Bacillota bacterium]